MKYELEINKVKPAIRGTVDLLTVGDTLQELYDNAELFYINEKGFVTFVDSATDLELRVKIREAYCKKYGKPKLGIVK